MTTTHTFKIRDDSTSFMISYKNREVYCKVPENFIKVNKKIVKIFFTDPLNIDLVHFGVIKIHLCDKFGNILFEYFKDDMIEIKRSDGYIEKRNEKCAKNEITPQTIANRILQDKNSLIFFSLEREDHIKLESNTTLLEFVYTTGKECFEVPKILQGGKKKVRGSFTMNQRISMKMNSESQKCNFLMNRKTYYLSGFTKMKVFCFQSEIVIYESVYF